MTNGFFDTFILACPSENADQVEFDRYLSGLVRWRDFVATDVMQVFVAANAPLVLGTAGGFPLWDVVASRIRRFGLDYQPSDVFSVLQRFLDRLPRIEDELSLDEILINAIECDAPGYEARPQPFVEDFTRLSALVCIFADSKGESLEDQAILTRDLSACPADFNFKADLIDIDADHTISGNLPRTIGGSLTAFSCTKNCEASVDSDVVWRKSLYRPALDLCIKNLRASSGATMSRAWWFGRRFVETVEGLGLRDSVRGRLLMRACAETVLELNMTATHAIRSGQGGNNPQLRRGKDAAWRRDIDNEYHLHYWSTEHGIEFAAAVVHNDFAIPE